MGPTGDGDVIKRGFTCKHIPEFGKMRRTIAQTRRNKRKIVCLNERGSWYIFYIFSSAGLDLMRIQFEFRKEISRFQCGRVHERWKVRNTPLQLFALTVWPGFFSSSCWEEAGKTFTEHAHRRGPEKQFGPFSSSLQHHPENFNSLQD